MDTHLIGETAALGTSFLWATCSILFASAGRRIGALSVNAFRIVMAVILLMLTHVVVSGTALPLANGRQWFFMCLSGIIGLAIGDFGYFSALVLIGPRRGVLMMSMAPIFSAISAYIVLGETLGAWTIIGIVITLSGVVWVILERGEAQNEHKIEGKKTLGVISGLGGAFCQGVGLVISKYGMIAVADDPARPLNPLSATLIRMVSAAIFVWIILTAIGKLSEVTASSKDGKAMRQTFGGAVTGPFLGVWLSMVAVTYTVAGVAATLMALMPVIIIPYIWILYRQRTSLRGILGAIVAVVGVAILFLL